jgi:hypothetical protein
MKSQHSIFKWIGVLVVPFIFINTLFASPLVYAQGENSPTSTETPTEIGGFLAQTPTPTPTLPSNPELQEPFSSFQSMQESTSSLESIWPAFNISDTAIPSRDASIAVDNSGKIHFVWVEDDEVYGAEPEVFYAVWSTENEQPSLSQPINVSNSPSAFSTMAQFVVDNTGKAHIVWGEDDTSDSDVFYSNCQSNENTNVITCSTPVNLSGPPDRQCGGRTNPISDLISGNPTIGMTELAI